MEFIETILFQKESKKILDDDQLQELQTILLLYPAMGAVIPGSGGLRKLRWVSAGKGKKGVLRIIYYWVIVDHRIILLHVYKKNRQEDLSSEQLKLLMHLMQEE